MTAVPKPQRIRSKALTNSARGRACTLRLDCCNGDPETTVFAHLRGSWSLGISTKPPDFAGCYSCDACHREQEAGHVPAADLLRAMIETQIAMARDGLLIVRGYAP